MKNLFAVLTLVLMSSWTLGCGAPKKSEPAPAPATEEKAPEQPTESTEKPAEKPAEETPAEKPEGGSAAK